MKHCPQCNSQLIFDRGWRCINSYQKSIEDKAICSYKTKDDGQEPDFEEALARAESRQNLSKIRAFEDINNLFR